MNQSDVLYFQLSRGEGLLKNISNIKLRQFPNGELDVEFINSVRDHEIVLANRCDTHDGLMEMLIAADAAKINHAKRVIGIIPYLPYSRKERKDDKRTSITSRLVADLLATSGFDHIITLDLHSTASGGFFPRTMSCDNLMPTDLFINQILKLYPNKEFTLVSPDAGFQKKANFFKKALQLNDNQLIVLDKERNKITNKIEKVTIISGELTYSNLIVMDDIVDTASTLIETIEALKQKFTNINNIDVFCTHGFFTKNASELIEKSSVRNIYTTTSVVRVTNNKIKYLDSSEIFKQHMIEKLGFKIENINQIKIQSLLNWYNQAFTQKLTELPDKNHHFWNIISANQKLCEEFIRKFKDQVGWEYISKYQKLSEEFIREFKDYVSWVNISKFQKLSEDFIREFKHEVHWPHISVSQKLSEEFIREFKDEVDWNYISKYQKLSEEFIREFKDTVDWDCITKYQKLSDEFWKEFKEQLVNKPTDNLLYWTNEQKLELLQKYPQYKIEDGYVYAFKGIRSDRYSAYNFQFKYEVGQTYECHADHILDNENSFGLSCWTYEEAEKYCDELVIKVRFKVEDLAAVVHEGGKLRVSKFEVLT
jgi:ribose-phosphate pyrophosphokinase